MKILVLLIITALFCALPCSDAAAQTPSPTSQEQQAQDFIDVLRSGNEWKKEPTDADISKAFEDLKKKHSDDLKAEPPPYTRLYPYTLKDVKYTYGSPTKMHNTAISRRFPELSNHVVLTYTVETEITTVGYDFKAQIETRRSEKQSNTNYAILAQKDESSFTFGEKGFDEKDKRLYASGWVTPPKNSVKLSGVISDAHGKPMPFVYCYIDAGKKKAEPVKVDSEGKYEYIIEIPEKAQEDDKKIVLTVCVSCRKEKTECFRMVQYPRPANEPNYILASTFFTVDPAIKELKKDISFASADKGYLSSIGNTADKASTNINSLAKLKHYSLAYRNLYDSWRFATENLRVNLSGNCPLWIEIESRKKTAFDYSKRLICLEPQYCGDNDSSRFTHCHEFGHYVMYTAFGMSWPSGAGGEGETKNVPHGGYVNDDTADSFMEAFATYFACLVAKHKDQPDKAPEKMGDLGDIQDEWKTFENEGLREEFAFAAFYWDLTRKVEIPYTEVCAILLGKKETFWQYYETFEKNYAKKEKLIKAMTVLHGIYCITLDGNHKYDSGEPYRDVNKSGAWDQGEYYVDFSVEPGTGAQFMGTTGIPSYGQSANYERVDKRYSTFHFPNSYLKVEGKNPENLMVTVQRQDGSEYQYTAPVYEGRVYIGLPPPSVNGKLMVQAMPENGGTVFYQSTLEVMRNKFDSTRMADSLDSFRIDRITIPGVSKKFSISWYIIALPVVAVALLALVFLAVIKRRQVSTSDEGLTEGDGMASAGSSGSEDSSSSDSGSSSGGDFKF